VGIPGGENRAIAEAIRTHQPRGEPMTMEAILLSDADFLEQLGAIGLVRAMARKFS
jgi:uncharacterized protein